MTGDVGLSRYNAVGGIIWIPADGNVTALFWAPKAFLKDSMEGRTVTGRLRCER